MIVHLRCRDPHGFTVIELMVVMALIALTLTIVAPRYLSQTDRTREAVLRNNLKETRGAIDRFYADTGAYPTSLQQLVDRRYLRALPVDPILNRSDAWTLTPAAANARPGSSANTEPVATSTVNPGAASGIFDLHSAAGGRATDGSAYATW
jgi:general secretion pathway protein G